MERKTSIILTSIILFSLIVGGVFLVGNIPQASILDRKDKADCLESMLDKQNRYETCVGECRPLTNGLVNCINTRADIEGIARDKYYIDNYESDEVGQYILTCYDREELYSLDEPENPYSLLKARTLQIVVECITGQDLKQECRQGETECMNKEYSTCDLSNFKWIPQGKIIGKCGVECIETNDCQDRFKCNLNRCVPETERIYFRLSNNECDKVTLFESELKPADFLTLGECEARIKETDYFLWIAGSVLALVIFVVSFLVLNGRKK